MMAAFLRDSGSQTSTEFCQTTVAKIPIQIVGWLRVLCWAFPDLTEVRGSALAKWQVSISPSCVFVRRGEGPEVDPLLVHALQKQ